jgi:hypothetical protein
LGGLARLLLAIGVKRRSDAVVHCTREAQLVFSVDHFRQELQAQMGRAATHGLIDILINSGELNRSIHRGELGTVSCCEAMQQEIKPRDVVVLDRHSGAGMTVRYLLPR